jgi:hypothetical protein
MSDASNEEEEESLPLKNIIHPDENKIEKNYMCYSNKEKKMILILNKNCNVNLITMVNIL